MDNEGDLEATFRRSMSASLLRDRHIIRCKSAHGEMFVFPARRASKRSGRILYVSDADFAAAGEIHR